MWGRQSIRSARWSAPCPRAALSRWRYIDPYNLEYLSFSIIEALASLTKVDLAINFSTMDLPRNAEFEFDPARARFDAAAPGWRDDPTIRSSNKRNVPIAFFNYWLGARERAWLSVQQGDAPGSQRRRAPDLPYGVLRPPRPPGPPLGDVAGDKNRTLDLF